jgi:hypothetical protein
LSAITSCPNATWTDGPAVRSQCTTSRPAQLPSPADLSRSGCGDRLKIFQSSFWQSCRLSVGNLYTLPRRVPYQKKDESVYKHIPERHRACRDVATYGIPVVTGHTLERSKELDVMKMVTCAAFGLAASLSAYGSASAAPVTYTWNPAAVIPTAPVNSNIVANNLVVSDFADIVITGSNFTENAVLTAAQFQLNGNPVAPAGFGAGGTYSFYATVTAAGTISGPIPAPGSGQTVNGTFTSATYTFWANPNSTPMVTTNPGGTPTISGNGGAFALFTGTLLSGTSGLSDVPAGPDNTPPQGYSPKADLNLTLSVCTAAGGVCTGNESAFFVNPLPADLTLAISDFSATTSQTALTPGAGGSTNLDITGGGGNVTFAVTPVPEPASLLVIGTSLVGLGIVRRRKRA